MSEPIVGGAFPQQIESFPRANAAVQAEEEKGRTSFAEHLMDALSGVNELQQEADQASQDLVTGELDNIHDLMIKTEEARMALQFTVQTTNKIVEAYEELSRMQI